MSDTMEFSSDGYWTLEFGDSKEDPDMSRGTFSDLGDVIRVLKKYRKLEYVNIRFTQFDSPDRF